MAGLGLGLGALLQDSNSSKAAQAEQAHSDRSVFLSGGREAAPEAAGGKYHVVMVKLEDLMPSVYQPRTAFDDEKIAELSASIKEHGLMQPLLVTAQDNGKYSIICGERRYRACKVLELEEVPCVISQVQNEEGYALALIENIQREDLNPMEESRAIKRMIEECGLTQENLAKTLGLSRGAVSHFIQLSNMHPEVQTMVEQGELSFSHAKVLFSLEGEAQLKAAKFIVAHGYSVRRTEQLVKELLSESENSEPEDKPLPPVPRLARFEDSLSQRFVGAKVKFSEKGSTGRVVLSYTNPEQLSKIMEALGISQEEYTEEPVEAMPIQD